MLIGILKYIFRNSTTQSKKKFRKEMKAAKSLALTLGVFTFCWYPVGVYQFYLYVRTTRETSYVILPWLYLLAYCNSGMNFVIYSAKNPDFKRAMRKFFKIKSNSVSEFSASVNETSMNPLS